SSSFATYSASARKPYSPSGLTSSPPTLANSPRARSSKSSPNKSHAPEGRRRAPSSTSCDAMGKRLARRREGNAALRSAPEILGRIPRCDVRCDRHHRDLVSYPPHPRASEGDRPLRETGSRRRGSPTLPGGLFPLLRATEQDRLRPIRPHAR